MYNVVHMADTDLTTTTILAGETLAATLSFAGYPAGDSITLRYIFRAGAMRTQAECAASGTDWTLGATAQETAQWEPGDCFFSGLYTSAAGVVTEIDSGAFIVRQNPLVRSYAEVTLAAIRAVISGRASSDQLTVALGDVQLSYMRASELTGWEAKYAGMVQAERNRMRRDRGLESRQTMGTRFV